MLEELKELTIAGAEGGEWKGLGEQGLDPVGSPRPRQRLDPLLRREAFAGSGQSVTWSELSFSIITVTIGGRDRAGRWVRRLLQLFRQEVMGVWMITVATEGGRFCFFLHTVSPKSKSVCLFLSTHPCPFIPQTVQPGCCLHPLTGCQLTPLHKKGLLGPSLLSPPRPTSPASPPTWHRALSQPYQAPLVPPALSAWSFREFCHCPSYSQKLPHNLQGQMQNKNVGFPL